MNERDAEPLRLEEGDIYVLNSSAGGDPVEALDSALRSEILDRVLEPDVPV